MILDQPTAGVDVGAKAELHRLIRLAASEGAAVMLISDDLDELLGLSDRIVVMSGGMAGAPLEGADLDRAKLLAAISRTAASSLAEVNGESAESINHRLAARGAAQRQQIAEGEDAEPLDLAALDARHRRRELVGVDLGEPSLASVHAFQIERFGLQRADGGAAAAPLDVAGDGPGQEGGCLRI